MVAALRAEGGVEEGAPAAASGRLPLRRLAPLLGAVGCVVGLEWTLTTWTATHLDEDVGLARDMAVALSSAFFGAMLVGRLVSSRLARRVGGQRLLLGALAVLVAALPLLVLARSVPAAVAGLVLSGAATGALFPLVSGLVLAASGAASTRASSSIFLVSAIAVLLGPLAVGGLAEAVGLRDALLIVVALPIAAAALVAVDVAREG
jgi:fucose permease